MLSAIYWGVCVAGIIVVVASFCALVAVTFEDQTAKRAIFYSAILIVCAFIATFCGIMGAKTW